MREVTSSLGIPSVSPYAIVSEVDECFAHKRLQMRSGRGIPSVNNGDDGNSGFLSSANKCGPCCHSGGMAVNGIQACFYGGHVFLAIV